MLLSLLFLPPEFVKILMTFVRRILQTHTTSSAHILNSLQAKDIYATERCSFQIWKNITAYNDNIDIQQYVSAEHHREILACQLHCPPQINKRKAKKRHQSEAMPHADPIRARYLHSLNVASSEPSLNTSPKRHKIDRQPTSSQIEKIPIHHEPLKDDNAKIDPDLVSALSSCSLASLSSKESSAMPPSCIITIQPDSTDLKYIPSSSMSPPTSSAFRWDRTYSRASLSSLYSISSSLDGDDETSTTSSKKRGVSFDASVSVKPIPTRNEYSDRIRPHLWTSPQEIERNARRNIFEFASEHYDWQRAVEETDMFIHAETGERVHPIHVQAAAARAQRTAAASRSRDHFIGMSRNKAAQN